MACGACAKKAAARQAAANQQVALPASIIPVPSRPEPIQEPDGLVRKRYIGPKQRIESYNSQFSYGVRNPGEVLLIFTQDAELHPEWWEDA